MYGQWPNILLRWPGLNLTGVLICLFPYLHETTKVCWHKKRILLISNDVGDSGELFNRDSTIAARKHRYFEINHRFLCLSVHQSLCNRPRVYVIWMQWLFAFLDQASNLSILTFCGALFCGREPWSIDGSPSLWSSGYGRRLVFQRSWVRISTSYTGWTKHFFTYIWRWNCNMCLKRRK